MSKHKKNPIAVALGKLKKGVKEKPSAKKRAAARRTLAIVRKLRWKHLLPKN